MPISDIVSVAQIPVTIGLALWAILAALSTYKKQQLWDRKLSALSEVVAALAAMRRLNQQWLKEFDEDSGTSGANEAINEEHAKRYRESEWKLRETATTARLLWPDGVPEILGTLELALDDADVLVDLGDYREAIQAETKAIDDAIDSLVAIGQKHVK